MRSINKKWEEMKHAKGKWGDFVKGGGQSTVLKLPLMQWKQHKP